MSLPKDETDLKILREAQKIFSQRGFYKTDVEEIASKAGVGKGTIYRRFGKKKSLFLSLIEWGLNSLRDEILKEIQEVEGPAERIAVGLQTYLSFFERNRDFYQILVEERMQFREEIGQQFEGKHLTHIPLLESTIDEGIRQGKFKNLNARGVAVSLVGMINAIIYDDLISRKRSSLQRGYQTVLEIFLRGIIVSNQNAVHESSRTKRRKWSAQQEEI